MTCPPTATALDDLLSAVPLRLDLYGPTGHLVAPVRLSVDLDGLSAERVKLAAERAVPGAQGSRISEDGPQGCERVMLTVTGGEGEPLASGQIESDSPSPA